MTQLKTFGFIFEQMCARDLRAYTPGFGNHLSYYRDRYGLEADLVLHLDDGRYALIECKLGSREIEEGSKHLLEIKRLIQVHNETEKQVPLRQPDLMIVMTGGSMAYTRPDGVKVIPLACLKDLKHVMNSPTYFLLWSSLVERFISWIERHFFLVDFMSPLVCL